MKTAEELLSGLQPYRETLHRVSAEIHSHPETALQEHFACRMLCKTLTDWGYQMRVPLLTEYPTSFRADFSSGDNPPPPLAFFAEYDALEGLGHACGHNLIAVSALAAFHLVCQTLKQENLSFALALVGTPAEESYSAKTPIAESGILDDLDAALISHPYDVTSMDDGALSVHRWDVTFHGKASHAGMHPELGINALDAMISLFNGINCWRQQLPESSRVHGIITNGGSAPNVIPDLTCATFYLRAPDTETEETMDRRFREIVQASAMANGCTSEVVLHGFPTQPCKVNAVLNQAYADAMRSLGETVRFANGTEGRGGTDFGNISQKMPGINVHFGICHQEGIALHTPEMRDAAATDYGFDQAMKCAAAMAHMALRYCTDPIFRSRVKNAFNGGNFKSPEKAEKKMDCFKRQSGNLSVVT